MEAKTALPVKQMFNNAARADWDANEVIQQLFTFVPYYEEDDTPCLYGPTLEKIKSIVDKSKTKLMNKKRTFAEERKGKAYCDEVEAEILFGLINQY
ncbi:hypothetical protein AHAS_Ahas13G0509000 [Arachis hypogaea]